MFDSLPRRRAIIDRRAVADRIATLATGQPLAELRPLIVGALKQALEEGRAEVAARLAERPTKGREAVSGLAFLTDQILRLLFDATRQQLYPNSNPTLDERVTLIAVGGYGRGEMAPHSDVDIGFITPNTPTGWAEQVIESMLYSLWDLGLKIGYSSRSIGETILMAKSDITIRTALLEARYVWGEHDLFKEMWARYSTEVMQATGRAFVTEKLAERDHRHQRMGDSRYVVEPNVKEGKGGLRDLHTLFWIGKYVHRVHAVADLVSVNLLSRAELRLFQKAENFLWAVRCHLHLLMGRAEDRLTFDLQLEVATRMQFSRRSGRSAVERFMHYYFLNAKTVGDLTALFLAHLEEKMEPQRSRIAYMFRRLKRLDGFVLERGQLALPGDDFFKADPIRLIEMFSLADRYGLNIHPGAMRVASRDSKLVDTVRNEPRANMLFMDVLTSQRDPEKVLRWMNEASVFGRFIPDFGRVVAQMQFDMYHHYTVDEHTIRAVGLLARIEKGEFKEEHPLSSELVGRVVQRRALYVSVLLHDIAKGRGGDHSAGGAEIALSLSPRLGMNQSETETVAWLVRHHLLMSATAFKRDLADFKTIIDFAEVVQNLERLRLLLLLTVVDIRAVGPGVWNSWKRQLLADIYKAVEEVLRLDYKQCGREERINACKATLQSTLGVQEQQFIALAKRFPETYWLTEPDDILAQNAQQILAADTGGTDGMPLSIEAQLYPERGATLVTVYAADHPGLFYRLAGAIHVAGGNIMDARIHTLRDGMAIDNFLVQDPVGGSFEHPDQICRIKTAIEESLANRHKLTTKLEARPLPRTRARAFTVAPNVLIDNKASNRLTVIEVNALDQPALLFSLAVALFQSKVTLHSAHVATYGERAVDTFYVTDLFGGKVEGRARLVALEKRLLEAAGVSA